MTPQFNRTLHKLRLRHFELLVLLASEGTVRGAARRMALTQPGVSKMLKEIEDCYGATLFERSASGVLPNALGKHLTKHVSTLMNDMSAVSAEISAMATGASSILRVGTVSVIPRVPVAVAKLRKALPQACVMVTEGKLPDLVKQLLDGELDCIVGALPPEMLESKEASQLHVETLAKDGLCVMANHGHALAGATRLTWQALAGHDWVLPPNVSLLRRAVVDAYLNARLVPPTPAVELLSPLSMGDLLALDGSLMGVMRTEQAQAEQAAGRLVILPVKPQVSLPPIALISCRRSGAVDDDMAAFRRALGLPS